ncbi:hypothetical protein [Belnapia sp. F-4-1]|uniref:hypothetical protein n=1 Tax=Belnapia sp. F-4-1 TaxID=1545443 RepID=UPI0011847C58|nr:hypothetical protein [Belnapia sp. F-4-1]
MVEFRSTTANFSPASSSLMLPCARAAWSMTAARCWGGASTTLSVSRIAGATSIRQGAAEAEDRCCCGVHHGGRAVEIEPEQSTSIYELAELWPV